MLPLAPGILHAEKILVYTCFVISNSRVLIPGGHRPIFNFPLLFCMEPCAIADLLASRPFYQDFPVLGIGGNKSKNFP
jgi:hypothetical protein